MTRQSPYAVLYQEDEIVTTGSQQVTAQMEEILGMDRMQYQQISMIAQGEFLKTLYAKGKERSEIFRKIFRNMVSVMNFRKRSNVDIFLVNTNMRILGIPC